MANNSVIQRTGNIAVDLVSGCIMHYRKFKKPIDVIYLSHSYWRKFKDYCKSNQPDFKFDDAIQFKDCVVMKGHRFMRENLEVKLKEVNAQLN